MDVAVFGPLKAAWKKTVDTWRSENGAAKIRKEDFAPLLKQTLDVGVSKNAIRNGFNCTGLMGLNPDAIDFRKLVINPHTQNNFTHSQWLVLRSHLTYLEAKIDSDKLKSFREERVEKEDTSLYLIWKNIRGEVLNYKENLDKQEARNNPQPAVGGRTNVSTNQPIVVAEGSTLTTNIFGDIETSCPIELEVPVIAESDLANFGNSNFHNLDILLHNTPPNLSTNSPLPNSYLLPSCSHKSSPTLLPAGPLSSPITNVSDTSLPPSCSYTPSTPLPPACHLSSPISNLPATSLQLPCSNTPSTPLPPACHLSSPISNLPATSLQPPCSNTPSTPLPPACPLLSPISNVPATSLLPSCSHTPTSLTHQYTSFQVTPTKIQSALTTPFKKALFWPEPSLKKKKTKKLNYPVL